MWQSTSRRSLPFWSVSCVLGQIPQCIPHSTTYLHLCKWIQRCVPETKRPETIWLCDRWFPSLLSLYVQQEHTLSIKEILQECDLKIIEGKTVKCSAYKLLWKAQIYIARVFPIYAITLQLYHIYHISKAPKLPASKHVFLSIQFVSKKFFFNSLAKIKRVELTRIHTTSKVLLRKPCVHAIYFDWQQVIKIYSHKNMCP